MELNQSKVGARIKAFRKRLDLSVEELARNAALDPGLVERIETGTAYPPIGVLVKLSRALGQRLGTFMDGESPKDIVVCHIGNCDTKPTGAYEQHPSICHYVPLGADKADRHMEPLFIEMTPAPDNMPTSSHEGEEFLLVLEGAIQVKYGHDVYLLKQGETVYYNSVVPHLVAAAPGCTAKVCAVVYTPV